MTVSVVLTCHNEERTIVAAVRSVVTQSASPRIEQIIVANDGSTDASEQLLQSLADEIPHLIILTLPGVGPAAARNASIMRATGRFIAFLDGDDFWAPDKIESQLEAFSVFPGVGLVYGDFVDFSAEDASDGRLVPVRRLRQKDQLREYFVHDAPILPSTVIVAREALDEVGLFDESLKIGEETELHLRIAASWRVRHVARGLTFKRRHPEQLSHRADSFLPNAYLVSERVAQQHAHLRPLVGRRMSRYYVKASADCAQKNERALARVYALKSLRLCPTYWRAWLNLLLVLIPRSASQAAQGLAKRTWHWGRQFAERSL